MFIINPSHSWVLFSHKGVMASTFTYNISRSTENYTFVSQSVLAYILSIWLWLNFCKLGDMFIINPPASKVITSDKGLRRYIYLQHLPLDRELHILLPKCPDTGMSVGEFDLASLNVLSLCCWKLSLK
jgi:hypothetical protein